MTKDENGNDVIETVEVPYLVGTEGAHSVVRKGLGLSFLGDTRNDIDMTIGDINITSGLDHNVSILRYRLQVGSPLLTAHAIAPTLLGRRYDQKASLKFFYVVFHKINSWDRAGILPSEAEDKVFTVMVGGTNFDYEKVASGREHFIEAIKAATDRTDLEFGEIVWLTRYR
jgi:hypothetical protein